MWVVVALPHPSRSWLLPTPSFSHLMLSLFLFLVSDRSCVSKTMPNSCLAETRSIKCIMCLYPLHGGRSQMNGIWSHLSARIPLSIVL
ncbi:uncharacterized protein LY79DRAFT_557840 [Colletotrichum navitas]|uniref:Uncharacterized protein n=1 Tax=Colletotrichum navitas TaxID=681940 RepID=A0AAD8PX61_9PEZI|nr:uncharacterized protein LY79DRAFT_557840 [Colletotrichum navitas]KAK1585808.1 hypothetical protein LY79DRAFT_557840 [Colletotrichum navitas]